MRICASDPVVSRSAADKLGIQLLPYEELLEVSDFLTFHVPLVEGTANMLNERAIARCKDGVRIINCARGGLMDEAAVLAGLESGKIAGVALDVYRKEPPPEGDRPLLEHPAVVTTPHIAASTKEAQQRVAQQVTEQLVSALKGEPVETAVNSMAIRMAASPEIGPYLELADRLGSLVDQLFEGQPEVLQIRLYGERLKPFQEIVSVAAIRGFVSHWRTESVNLINARMIAEETALKIEEHRRPEDDNFKNLIEVVASNSETEVSAAGVVFGNRKTRVIRINGLDFEIQPVGHILFYYNDDKPGMLAGVGSILAESGINIGALALGRREKGSTAMTAVSLDEPIADSILDRIAALEGVHGIRTVQFK
jgi:D-3-phosphoglycerate dehydrogenase